MSKKHSAVQLFEFHSWANGKFFGHLDSLPDGIYTQTVDSVFPSIRDVIVHIYQVDTMWLSVMSGDSFRKTMTLIKENEEKSAGRTLQEMRMLYEEAERSYASFFGQLDDPDADLTISHPRYGKLDTSVADLVRHVANHGTYHRGNITAMLHQMGHSGVPTDYVFYLFELNRPSEQDAPDGL
jgi:uncharacterized damage-inducible protein DinB